MKNLKISKRGKRTELELSCDFYPERIIRKAAKDFGKILKADIEEKGGKFVITLKPKRKGIELEKATYEFMNYLLAEVKNETVRV